MTVRYLSRKSNYIEHFMVVTAVAELAQLMEKSRLRLDMERICFVSSIVKIKIFF